MTKVQDYREELRSLPPARWEGFLREHSGIPGPRGNLSLGEAVAEEGAPAQLRAMASSDNEFLAFCGAYGLGRLAAEGDDKALGRLRAAASDPRWRVREGVAMGLQRLGDEDPARLVAELRRWRDGGPLERRAVVAALCEPRLLRDPATVGATLDLLDEVTASLVAETDRRSDGFKALRKTLGYGWSVAVAADPEHGRPRIARWLDSSDRDLRWVMRENLRKQRLACADAAWVERSLVRLGG